MKVIFYDFPSFGDNTTNQGIAGVTQNVSVTNVPLPVSLPLPYGTNNQVTSSFGLLVSGTSSVTLTPGTAGLNTYVVGYDISFTGNISAAVSSLSSLTISYGSSIPIATYPLFMPAVAGTSPLSTMFSERFVYPCLIDTGILPSIVFTTSTAISGTGGIILNLFTVTM